MLIRGGGVLLEGGIFLKFLRKLLILKWRNIDDDEDDDNFYLIFIYFRFNW